MWGLGYWHSGSIVGVGRLLGKNRKPWERSASGSAVHLLLYALHHHHSHYCDGDLALRNISLYPGMNS